MDDNIPLDGVFHGYDELDNERIDLDFCWVSLEDLKKGTKVYPLELIPYILESGKEIVHFVSKQKAYNAEKVLNVASYAHMYVFEFDGKIIGTGSISSFWGSETESILLSIFVLPEFHGKGVGRKIINTLETDEFYVRASRIEIPASITATEFYRKFGYDYKNGVKELDNEHHYRLEKFKEAGLK